MFWRKRGDGGRGRRLRIRKLRLLALLILLLLLGTASFAYGLVTALGSDIPRLDPSSYRQERNSYVYAADGTVLAVLRGAENRVVVPSEEIAPVMKQAIVAVEDRRFFEHRGVDLRGIVRAVWQDLRSGAVREGGSTITQQFVKNAYVHSSRSFERKLKEAALAWQLENEWSKDRILTAYLNTIYFGNGAYGVEQASRVYFHHAAARLSLPEAALLAGIPADPSRYDPAANPGQARQRRGVVLRAMLEQGLISYGQFRTARRAPLPVPDRVRLPGSRGPAPYFANYVTQLLVDRYGTGRVFGGGLRVRTSIDLRLQKAAREAIAKWLPGESGPSASLVAIDPRDGRVLAMVGGRNFRESQFNLAVQAQRQPGSAFKPFVLAAALAQGISPRTTLVSKPVIISLGDRDWRVHNYEGSNLGPIDLETATIHSDNTVFAQLTTLVRPSAVARTAALLGVKSPIRGYFSVGLGGEAVNPLEMARAYATLANGGRRIDGTLFGNEPRAVLAVGKAENRPVGRPVLGQNEAGIVTTILREAVESGTGRRAQLSGGRPVAGKTGTTENYGDAWFVGYTPGLAVAVWVGYADELRPMLHEFRGGPVAGGTFPALIFKSFLEAVLPRAGDEEGSFAPVEMPAASPQRVVLRDGRWWRDNGYCRNTIAVQYVAGREPPEADCKPNEVDVPRVVGLAYEEARSRLALQPLEATLVSRPALPGERVGVVLAQMPRPRARLSSFDSVKLVVAKPLHGVVPDLVGLPVEKARRRCRRLGLQLEVRPRAAPGSPRLVLSQEPKPGVAASPGMRIRLTISRGETAAGG